jgi:lipopolysaccharide transport system ATP-binding protein
MVFHLREESPALGLPRVGAGDYSIGVSIPPLWLNSGLYSLSFKVLLWGVSENARHVSDKFPLDVTGGHSRVDALLHPEGTWTVRSEAEAS